jgi:hypothetical protein
MAALTVEGLNKSAIARAMRITWNTVHRWLERAGSWCRRSQKFAPAFRSTLSWRTKLIVAFSARAWTKIVLTTALAPTAKGITIAT